VLNYFDVEYKTLTKSRFSVPWPHQRRVVLYNVFSFSVLDIYKSLQMSDIYTYE